MIRAVFFDVDFTLIYPGPTFQAEGYRRACAARGIEIDPSKFDAATAASSFILDEVEEQIYKHDIFIHYTASIIEKMGGRGANVVDLAVWGRAAIPRRGLAFRRARRPALPLEFSCGYIHHIMGKHMLKLGAPAGGSACKTGPPQARTFYFLLKSVNVSPNAKPA